MCVCVHISIQFVLHIFPSIQFPFVRFHVGCKALRSLHYKKCCCYCIERLRMSHDFALYFSAIIKFLDLRYCSLCCNYYQFCGSFSFLFLLLLLLLLSSLSVILVYISAIKVYRSASSCLLSFVLFLFFPVCIHLKIA